MSKLNEITHPIIQLSNSAIQGASSQNSELIEPSILMKCIPEGYIANRTHNVKNADYNALCKNPQASQIHHEPNNKKYN